MLNTRYKVHINRKVEQSSERSTALPPSRSNSYWKVSLQVVLDYSRQLYKSFTGILLVLNNKFDMLLNIETKTNQNLKPFNYVQTNKI